MRRVLGIVSLKLIAMFDNWNMLCIPVECTLEQLFYIPIDKSVIYFSDEYFICVNITIYMWILFLFSVYVINLNAKEMFIEIKYVL